MDEAAKRNRSEIMKNALAKKNGAIAADAERRMQAKNSIGQFQSYPDELWDEVLSRAAAGHLFRKITADLNLSSGAILAKIYADHDFAERFYQALSHSMLSISLDTIDIADGGELSSGDVQRDRLMIETRKWLAERLNKRFSNRPTIEAQQVVINLPDDWKDVQF